MSMDEVSKAIGRLEGLVEGFTKQQEEKDAEHRETVKDLYTKLTTLHGDLGKIKVQNAVQNIRISGTTGILAAIGTFGLTEGLKWWFKTHAGP